MQAIYNFALRPRGIRSSVELLDTLCTRKLRAAKYGQVKESLPQTNYSEFDLGLFGLAHVQKLLFINFRSLVWACINVTCTRDFILQSD